jgi:hypothetical protein
MLSQANTLLCGDRIADTGNLVDVGPGDEVPRLAGQQDETSQVAAGRQALDDITELGEHVSGEDIDLLVRQVEEQGCQAAVGRLNCKCWCHQRDRQRPASQSASLPR